MRLSETCWERTGPLWWRHVESVRGRVAELITTVALSVYAVTWYPDNAGALAQALIQSSVVVGGLLVFALLWLAIVFVAFAPRALNQEARAALEHYQTETPRLVIGDPYPAYGVDVDGTDATVWRVEVSNTTPNTLARNVEVVVFGTNHVLPSFPITIHQRVMPREALEAPPVVTERRDIRYGDPVVYDLLNEQSGGVGLAVDQLEWHSAQFNHGVSFHMATDTPRDAAMIQAEIDQLGHFEFSIRAVADPASVPAARVYRLSNADGDRMTLCDWWIAPAGLQ